MHPSVKAAFLPKFTIPLEGKASWMYLDQKGLVTTGIGNLIDPYELGGSLPWRHKQGGPLASQDEVGAAWHAVKSASDKADLGGGNIFWQNLNDLRLNDDDIAALSSGKLDSNEKILKDSFPAWESWPADAQMATLSMAWAMGPSFAHGYPSFTAAVNAMPPDFTTAAKQSFMHGVGIEKRNAANQQLFLNAANVLKNKLPADKLGWPDTIPDVVKKTNKVVLGVLGVGGLIGAALVLKDLADQKKKAQQ
jgi:hypothetical protein